MPRRGAGLNQGTTWWVWLGVVCAAGLALRVAYVFLLARPLRLTGDPYQYHHGANLLVDGHGFIDAAAYLMAGKVRQSAQHPPLYTLALAAASATGLRSILAHQLLSCAIGTATVAVMGVLGRRLVGPVVGLAAAYLTAFVPDLWIFDGVLFSETLSLLMVAAVLLAAYRLWVRATLGSAVGLGLVCALAALARAELTLLLPLLLVLFVWAGRRPELRHRLGLAVAAGAVAVAVVFPWVAYNLSRFHRPVLGTSTGFPLAFAQANCPPAYYGPTIGSFSLNCLPNAPPGGDETDDFAYFQERARDYARAHAGRIPAVVVAREGRAWGVFDPFGELRVDIQLQRRDLGVARMGLWAYWALVALAVPGAVILRRRGVKLAPLGAVLATVAVAVAVTFGSPRYRVSAELVFILLAATAVGTLWDLDRDEVGRADAEPESDTNSAGLPVVGTARPAMPGS